MTCMRLTGNIPAIDGLRAVAVLSVMIFHADFLGVLPGGFTGVDIFFVISGYVISQSLSGRSDQGFAAYLTDFYRRRLLRIMPALLVVLVTCSLISSMFVPQAWLSQQNDSTGLAAFFGLSNFVLAWNTDTYFSPSALLNPYTHTWTLAVEEQFYLVFPLIYFAWLRYKDRHRSVWLILPLLALISLAVSAVQTRDSPLEAFYLLPSRFWELAAGAILYQLTGSGRFTLRSPGILLYAGLTLITAGFLLADENQFPFPWALVSVTGTLLVISALVQPTAAPSLPLRLLQSSTVTYIGRISYSLYLWHWPVLVFLRWTIGLEQLSIQLAYPFIVMALAATSYHCIELPLRHGRLALGRSPWVPIAGCLVATGVSWSTAQWVSDNSEVLSLSNTRDTSTWFSRRVPQHLISDPVRDPQWEDRQLFVIGDSHAAAYRTLLSIASQRLGIRVVEYERGGCAVVNLITPDPQGACTQARESALRKVETQAKPGDIVFLASLRMPELAGRGWARGDAEVLEEVLSELTPNQIDGAHASARAVLSRLMATQVQVLIDAPKPIFKAPPYRCSDWFNRLNPICADGFSMDRDQLERLRGPQMALIDRLTEQYPMVHVWDPLPLLCPGKICSAFADGKPLYRDADHLSGYGNRVLEADFTEVLLTILKSAS